MLDILADTRGKGKVDKMSVPLLLLPLLLLLLLLLGMVPVTSVEGSVQIASFRKWRKTASGPLICPLDLANETVSSSSLQDCSRSCARVITCSSFSIKNSLICDLYHYKARLAAPVSGCINYQVLSRSRSLPFPNIHRVSKSVSLLFLR